MPSTAPASSPALQLEQSLAWLCPDLAIEWHSARNGHLMPSSVAPTARVTAWWLCPAGHGSWEASVVARAEGLTWCPDCGPCPDPRAVSPEDGPGSAARNHILSRQLASTAHLPRVNFGRSLARLYPDVAAQWHPTLNRGVSAESVGASSPLKAWWDCPEGHAPYAASIRARTYHGSGCPVCGNERSALMRTAAWREENGWSLADRFPDVAAEWDGARNGTAVPAGVSASANCFAWWLCPSGHGSYRARVHNRTNSRTGCPRCALVRRSVPGPGLSLADRFPEVAARFDLRLNRPDTPQTVLPAARGKRYWFRCPGCDTALHLLIASATARPPACRTCREAGLDVVSAAPLELLAA
ncbi:zinc-ribbon domain-containing protein [Tersicoccus sp. MR15.9]